MMFAASSASGSWQYLLAKTKQASASCTWQKNHKSLSLEFTFNFRLENMQDLNFKSFIQTEVQLWPLIKNRR